MGPYNLKEMKRYSFMLVAIFAFALLSCEQGADPVSELDGAVIAVHDEVMPMMGEIQSLKKQLTTKAEGLALEMAADPAKIENTEEVQEIYFAVESLEDADKGMMNWMRDYAKTKVKLPEMDKAEALGVLEVEMDKVGKVKTQILESIAGAKALLE